MNLKNIFLPILKVDEKDYIHFINDVLRKVFAPYREVHKNKDATLREILLFLIGVLGYLSTEMLTSVFSHANLGSIRTELYNLYEENLINQIKIGDRKKHEDSLVCTLYCLLPRGRANLLDRYPEMKLIEVTGPNRTTLHSYYTSICLFASYMQGLPCKWEYEVYSSTKTINGIRVKEGLLRPDSVVLGNDSYCMIETDTGSESLQQIYEKLMLYRKHDSFFISSDLYRQNYTICFAVMKPRISLADEPRYSPAKLRVIRELIKTSYVEKRMVYFSELTDVRYERTGLSRRKCMICREVVKDMISNSPIDLSTFRLEEFERYYSTIVSQSSRVYQEDRARVHDHLCKARIDNLTHMLIVDLKSGAKNLIVNYLLTGKECYFVPALRLNTFLPLVFRNELIVNKKDETTLQRYNYIVNQVFKPAPNLKYYSRCTINPIWLKPGAPADDYYLINAFYDDSDGLVTIYSFENIEYDLGARVRVAFAEHYLNPPHEVFVVFICIVNNEDSFNRLEEMWVRPQNANDNVMTIKLDISKVVPQDK